MSIICCVNTKKEVISLSFFFGFGFSFTRRDGLRPVLEIAARKHDAVLAGETDKADIRAKADDFPLESPTGMSLAHFYDISDSDFSEHASIIHFQ
jgi:hypothetical protein